MYNVTLVVSYITVHIHASGSVGLYLGCPVIGFAGKSKHWTLEIFDMMMVRGEKSPKGLKFILRGTLRATNFM